MNRSESGRRGEDKAAAFLETAGMRIIARNFRSPAGEIDLVALEGETLVFTEVKAWSAYGIEDLPRSIGPKKRRRIVETAKYFLASHREYNCMAIRFDVIFIGPETIHLAAAFMEQE